MLNGPIVVALDFVIRRVVSVSGKDDASVSVVDVVVVVDVVDVLGATDGNVNGGVVGGVGGGGGHVRAVHVHGPAFAQSCRKNIKKEH